MDSSQSVLNRFVLPIVIVLLLTSNGFLIYQNLNLRTSLDQAKRFVPDAGYQFDTISATTLDGDDAPIVFTQDGKSTILLIFNTNCQYCLQQYPYWRELVTSVNRNEWNIIAISSERDTDIIGKHLEEHGLSNIDVRVVQSSEISKGRLGYTPMTLTVDSTGILQQVFAGLWTKDFGVSE